MSHRLDQLFRDKAKEVAYPFREEYIEEAAAMWDEMDSRRKVRWWTVLVALLLIGLITGFVWYSYEQGIRAEEKPSAESTEQSIESRLERDISSPETPSQNSLKPVPGLQLEQQNTSTDAREDQKKEGEEGERKEESGHIPIAATGGETNGTGNGMVDDKRTSTGLEKTKTQRIDRNVPASMNNSAGNRIEALSPLKSGQWSGFPPVSVEKVSPVHLNPIPRAPVFVVGGGGVYSSDQSGVEFSTKAAIPIGRSFYAGLGLTMQRIGSSFMPDYRVSQIRYDLGSVTEQYDIEFGPRYELSAHGWIGCELNRHMLSLAAGAGRVVALSSDWSVDRQEVNGNTELAESPDLGKHDGKHWVDLDDVEIQPFVGFSYAYSILPRLSLEISYRHYLNLGNASEALAFNTEGTNVSYPSGEEDPLNWSEDPNRFSIGVQYQINQ